MAPVIDVAHSHVYFTARHMMISKVRGAFTQFDGTVEYDPANPTATKVDVTIDVNSINTKNADRDNHLRSADFFDVESYPTMRFVSSRVEQIDEFNAKLYGELTIRDVTRDVVLDVSYVGTAKNPFDGSISAGFNASTTINRKDWGLTWNVALESGGWLVGEQIAIDIELQLAKVAEATSG